jgi:hypothetical protein
MAEREARVAHGEEQVRGASMWDVYLVPAIFIGATGRLLGVVTVRRKPLVLGQSFWGQCDSFLSLVLQLDITVCRLEEEVDALHAGLANIITGIDTEPLV